MGMKNILLITNIYPNNDPEYSGTAVCHTFAKEWMAMGYNVKVIHFDSLFPRPYYWFGKLFNARIKAKTGTVAYTKTPRKPLHYLVDGVPVIFVPLKKIIPHKAPSQKQTDQAFRYLVEELGKDSFVPDIITAHFVMPQLLFLPLFKKQYPKARTCFVLHGDSINLQKFYPKQYQNLMCSVDIWGFRSLAFQLDFEKRFGKNKPMFLCHSGIPENYITMQNTHRFDNPIPRIVYVGDMIERKYPIEIVNALDKAYPNGNYILTYVGGGLLLEKIRERVNKGRVKGKVLIMGRIPRDDIKVQYDDADIMVMISKREAYGLVYLEAMARGCITIASRNEGFDGIIVDGENGFLCKAGDSDELASIFLRIQAMTIEEKLDISQKAINTARSLNDYEAAKRYINNLEENYK